MSGGKFDLGNYVEVDERITRFYDRYPEGRIATIGVPHVLVIDGKSFIVAQAGAWRTADDQQPCIGTAAEPFPGQTTFTKNSEMMNAETSAWGRALVAAGILAKGEGVASKTEVRNRQAERPTFNGAGTVPPANPTSVPPADSVAPSPAPSLKEAIAAAVEDDKLTQGELGQINELYELGKTLPKTPQLPASIQALVMEKGFDVVRKRLIAAHHLQCGTTCAHFKTAKARSD